MLALEERWYDVEVVTPAGKWNRIGPMPSGNRQFVVEDPDGYLLRLFTSLGTRSSDRTAETSSERLGARREMPRPRRLPSWTMSS